MKKIALAAAISLGALSAQAAMVEADFLFGLNLLNSVDGAEGADMDFLSPTTLWDFLYQVNSQFGVGIGTGFTYSSTSDRAFAWMWTTDKGYTAGNYIMPLYAVAKYKFAGNESIQPYAKLKMGYAFWWADDGIDFPIDYWVYDCGTNGGFYFGLGAGVKFGKFVAELNYSTFGGEIYTNYRYNGYTYHYNPEVDFNFLSLTVGFSL